MNSHNHPSLQHIVDCYCSHIRRPFTLEEIVQKIESGDYNAEMLLQHLLVWVHKETDLRAEPNPAGTIAARLNFWKVRCEELEG